MKSLIFNDVETKKEEESVILLLLKNIINKKYLGFKLILDVVEHYQSVLFSVF